jgi:hypothetical protein
MDVTSGRELWHASGGVTGVGTLTWSPTGDRLATSGGEPRAVRVWEPATGKLLRTWPTNEHHTVIAFSPDGKRLAGGGAKLRLWDLSSGDLVREFGKGAASLLFSPDGRLLFAGENSSISIWEVETGRRRSVIDDHLRGGVFVIAATPDGRSFLSGCWDGQVRVWELATLKQRAHLAGHVNDRWIGRLGLSPDGRAAASSGADGNLFVWDLTGQAPTGRLAPVTLPEADLEGLWQLLAGDDAAIAYRASWRLTAAGDGTVAFLKEHLAPVPRDIDKHVEQLLADLRNENEAARQAATVRLEQLGRPAAPGLKKAFAGCPEGEVRDRIEYLLDWVDRPITSAEVVRVVRAVEVLERIRTPAARALLTELAEGLPEAVLTREARESRARLGRP